jgi:hypothetical protein
MYLNRWVLLVSLAVGLAGTAAVGRAFAEYRDATRAYSAIEVTYVPGSFAWQDTAFSGGQAELRISNRSPRRVTVEFFDVNLYLDGQFAGSDYTTWQPIDVARDGEQHVTTPLELAISSLRPQAAEADVTLRGQVRLRFDGIERPLTLRFRIPVGRVE